MAATMFNSLADLRPGSFNWNVRVRIIRQWKGFSRTGDAWKGLNLLLLDDQNTRIHAFMPGNVIDAHESKLHVGNICVMKNFTVKEYTTEDKFRCINHDKQIIFTSYTEVTHLGTDDHLIQLNMFDFFELSALDKIANKNIFLTDVIGIIEKDTPIAELTNRYGKKQKQIKFNIVDGRSSVNVSFWDLLAEQFSTQIEHVKEHPTIIIIASARVTSWQPANQADKLFELSNVACTQFYINYKHENVSAIRKMLGKPLFAKYAFENHVKPDVQTLPVFSVLRLSKTFVEKEVICSVTIKSVLETPKCFDYYCTSCYKIIEFRGAKLQCYRCSDRIVPEPELKWHVEVVGEDETGKITIALLDREIRSVLGLCVEDFQEEVVVNKKFPTILKSMEGCHYWIRLRITEANVQGELTTYCATGVYTETSSSSAPNGVLNTPKTQSMMTTTQLSGPTVIQDELTGTVKKGKGSTRTRKGKAIFIK